MKDTGKMTVKLRTAGALTRSLPGGKDVIEGRDLTVRKLLDALVARYGPTLEEELLEQGDLKEGLCVLVNGLNILSQPKKYETPLQDGDEVFITIVVTGG